MLSLEGTMTLNVCGQTAMYTGSVTCLSACVHLEQTPPFFTGTKVFIRFGSNTSYGEEGIRCNDSRHDNNGLKQQEEKK